MRYTLSTAEPFAVEPRLRIAPGELAPVVVGGTIELRRWGLLRRFRGHGGKRGPAIVAEPLAVVARSPQLRDATPCLVIADGWLARGRWIHASTPGAITFAGVTETSKDDGVPSFALVLGADPAMPIVVPPERREAWLDKRELIDEPPAGWRDDAEAKLGKHAQGELF